MPAPAAAADDPLSRFRALLLAAAVAGTASGARAAADPPPRYRLVQDGDTAWFVAPDGRRFTSRGVDCIGPGPDAKDYRADHPEYAPLLNRREPYEVWAGRTRDRLTAWGFNTVGGWSDTRFAKNGLPYTVVLHVGIRVGMPWVDVWDPDVVRQLRALAVELTATTKGDPNLLGYFLDNEFGWADQWLLAIALRWGRGQPGKGRLVETLKRTYGGKFARFAADFTTTARDWDGLLSVTTTGQRPGRGFRAVDAWTYEVARAYDLAAAKAVRDADPGALVLGDRFRQFYPQAVARAARGILDAVSTNFEATTTDGWISPCYFRTLHELSGLPVVVGEFYATARANRSGNRNHGGEFTLVDTQAQRAEAAAAQARAFARMPWVAGWHWFQWCDEPAFGRGDGEDYNMGLVDIYDEPYAPITRSLAAENGEADRVHAAALADGPAPAILPVPHRPGLVADGRLGDWDKGVAVPRALLRTDAPVRPFGDVFLGWTTDRLWVAVRAYAFTPPDEAKPDAADPATWTTLHRLDLTVGKRRTDQAATGVLAKPGAPGDDAGTTVLYAVPPEPGRTSAAFASAVDRWFYVWEVAVPAKDGAAFAAGQRIPLKLVIRNRGDYEIMRLDTTVELTSDERAAPCGPPEPRPTTPAPAWPAATRWGDGPMAGDVLSRPRPTGVTPPSGVASPGGVPSVGVEPIGPTPVVSPGPVSTDRDAGKAFHSPEKSIAGGRYGMKPRPAPSPVDDGIDDGESDHGGHGPAKPSTPETKSPVPETKVVPGKPPVDNPGQGADRGPGAASATSADGH